MLRFEVLIHLGNRLFSLHCRTANKCRMRRRLWFSLAVRDAEINIILRTGRLYIVPSTMTDDNEWIVEIIAGYLGSPDWIIPITHFMENKCSGRNVNGVLGCVPNHILHPTAPIVRVYCIFIYTIICLCPKQQDVSLNSVASKYTISDDVMMNLVLKLVNDLGHSLLFCLI